MTFIDPTPAAIHTEPSTRQRAANAGATLREQANLLNVTLHHVINSVPAHVWSTLPDGTLDFINERWQEFTGLPPERALGWNWEDAVHPEDRARFSSAWRAALQSGQSMAGEVRVRRADGEYRWVLVRNVPLRDEQGNIVKWYGTGVDISDRKRAEALLAGEKRILEMAAKGDPLPRILEGLCRLVEEQASGVLASILLLEGNCLRHGAAPSLPKAYTDVIDGASIGPVAGSCGTAAWRGKQVIVEDIASDPLWAEYRGLALPHSLRACWSTPIFSSQGKVIATFAMYYRECRSPSVSDQEIIEQITHLAGIAIERDLTQGKLRRSESCLAEAQKLTHTGSWAYHPGTGKSFYWSEEMFRIWGFDPQQGIPDAPIVSQRIHPDDLERVRELLESARRGEVKRDFTAEHRIVLPDGTLKHIEAIGHPVLGPAGEVLEYIGTCVDVTERKQAAEELRGAETRFRTYVDHATDALFVYDEKGKIVDVNREACHSLGYSREELIGKTPGDLDLGVDRNFRRWVQERLDAGDIVAFETSHRRKDGTVYPVEVRVRPFSRGGRHFGLALARDITDRKRAEQERERSYQLQADLAHMNRLTTMGELTASLAHEVNQPIAAAAANASACLRWLDAENPDIEEVRDAAARIVKDAKRAAEIVSRVRVLFKKSAPKREVLDVNEVVDEIVVLLRGEAAKSRVSFRSELAADLPRVMGDRVQLQQVLMNLVINGIDAMKDVERNRELTLGSRLDGDHEVAVSVSDTGTGLPPDTRHIFDAFFTTKPDGTGMGLAISRTIVESHGGRLWATANPGPGATFQFTLPATPTPP
jgi:PAS domain S-box-containing protein